MDSARKKNRLPYLRVASIAIKKRIWQTGFSLNELAELGVSLGGSDVPVFVRGISAFCLQKGLVNSSTKASPKEKMGLSGTPRHSYSYAHYDFW
ncbi:unnamed protein product [Ranitomeya imitator]|uniref:Uncharacterized protein n=1 Tax=Ranitomeya imitator TaxID=111125 RepID=A0ABN9LNG1_9NEOB|nr:unnamed protein product [Ranitomeya imitator]